MVVVDIAKQNNLYTDLTIDLFKQTWWKWKCMIAEGCHTCTMINVKRMACCRVNSLLIVFTATSNQIEKQCICAAHTSFLPWSLECPHHFFHSMNISDGYRFVTTFPKRLSRYSFMWYQSTHGVMCFYNDHYMTWIKIVKYFENLWWEPKCGRIFSKTDQLFAWYQSTNWAI